jgi:2-polyprenyl-3-methyl-5-hydroxy-6-metoxy-1,4-benzoquinol methylase
MIHDWQVFLHEQVRSPELRRLPAGAKTVLSGGAAGGWYFDWFNHCYPTPVERHIAIEAFSPEPRELPAEVEWHSRTLGDLEPVADGEVDLVFGGEVLEHLWPEDIAGFLLEAERVLRIGGTIALDSPNRRVTTAVDWLHPEHTVEFTVDEAVGLLAAAGFANIAIRGGWLTYDNESHRFLPLELVQETGSWPWQRRVAEAYQRPIDSFIWWAQAQKRDATHRDPERLEQIVWRAFSAYRAFRFSRLRHEIGRLEWFRETVAVRAGVGEAGYLIVGPNLPMPPGAAAARFNIAARGVERPVDDVVTLEVTSENGSHTVARRRVSASELPFDGSFATVELPFDLPTTTFGVEFRAASTGQPDVAVDALLSVEVYPPGLSRVKMGLAPMDDPATQGSPRPEAAPADRPSIARRLARLILWPAMRFFDPRFRGLGEQMTVLHEDQAHRLGEIRHTLAGTAGHTHEELAQLQASVGELDRLARTDLEIATDATTLMGEAVAEVGRVGSETLELVRQLRERESAAYVERLAEGAVDDLDAPAARLLNYAESHRGFAAQRNLWFNPAVSLSYDDASVAVGQVNERIVEVPYVMRALAAVPSGANVLDVGATESLLSLYLASLGYNVTALDPRRYPLEHPRLDVVTAEVQHWEPQTTFDAVVCLSTIEHIGLGAYGQTREDERADLAAMQRIQECLYPNGLLVLTTPFGTARTDAFSRVYDRAALDELLDGWAVSDLTIARRRSDALWAIVDDTDADENGEAVALVTATPSQK